MNLIALGFWLSAGMAILELLGVISVGWLWVATPFLMGIGISLGIFVIAALFWLVALIAAAILK